MDWKNVVELVVRMEREEARSQAKLMKLLLSFGVKGDPQQMAMPTTWQLENLDWPRGKQGEPWIEWSRVSQSP